MSESRIKPFNGDIWKHHNDLQYRVIGIANKEDKPPYPADVVYENTKNGNLYTKRLSLWHSKMTFICDRNGNSVVCRSELAPEPVVPMPAAPKPPAAKPFMEKNKGYQVWDCKVVVAACDLPKGFDAPPRAAVERAMYEHGIFHIATYSGWGGSLTKEEEKFLNESDEFRVRWTND